MTAYRSNVVAPSEGSRAASNNRVVRKEATLISTRCLDGPLHFTYGRFLRSACNPLEVPCAPIVWDMRTVLNTGNPQQPTAYINYNHTCCFPSHQIKVNDQVVYLYTPTRNDTVYIANCLLFQLGKITRQTSPVNVASH